MAHNKYIKIWLTDRSQNVNEESAVNECVVRACFSAQRYSVFLSMIWREVKGHLPVTVLHESTLILHL